MNQIPPQSVCDLVAFWDFQEAQQQIYRSHGPQPVQLGPRDGGVEVAEEGVFGSSGIRFTGKGYLCAPRVKAPQLSIGGQASQVSVVAWLKREKCLG